MFTSTGVLSEFAKTNGTFDIGSGITGVNQNTTIPNNVLYVNYYKIWDFLLNSHQNDIIFYICTYLFDVRNYGQHPTDYFLAKIRKSLGMRIDDGRVFRKKFSINNQPEYSLYQIIFSYHGVMKAIKENRLIQLFEFQEFYLNKFDTVEKRIMIKGKPKKAFVFYSICCSTPHKFKKNKLWLKRYHLPVNSKIELLDEYNQKGYHKKGYNLLGFDSNGLNRLGYNKTGFDLNGFKKGFDIRGYDENGFDRFGYNEEGYDKEGNRDDSDYDDGSCRDCGYLSCKCSYGCSNCGRGSCHCDDYY
jgi:hypothetical protein